MVNNQNINKKAVASIVFSTSSILLSVMLVVSYMIYSATGESMNVGLYLFGPAIFLFIKIGWVLPILGFILGIISIKSVKRNIAVIEIILSIMALMGFIYLYLIALKIGTG